MSATTFPGRSERTGPTPSDQFINVRRRTIEAACFGIAGPVIDGRAKLPNLPWSVDGDVLARHLGLPQVELLNDLEANAHGIATLSPDDLVPLN